MEFRKEVIGESGFGECEVSQTKEYRHTQFVHIVDGNDEFLYCIYNVL